METNYPSPGQTTQECQDIRRIGMCPLQRLLPRQERFNLSTLTDCPAYPRKPIAKILEGPAIDDQPENSELEQDPMKFPHCYALAEDIIESDLRRRKRMPIHSL